MRISAQAFLNSTLLLFLTAGLLVPDAAAGSVFVQFAGKVTGTLPGDTYPGNVATNDTISTNSSFAYNPAAFSLKTSTTGTYVLNGTNPTAQSFTLDVNTPGFSTTVWSDGYLGNPNAFTLTMSKSGSTSTLDLHVATYGGTAEAGSKVNASIDLVFTSTTYTAGLALPTSTNLSKFLLTNAALTWDPPGGQGFMGTADNFILNGQSVPEPSTLVLAVIAMATSAGFLISRRKAAGALQRGRIAAPPSHP